MTVLGAKTKLAEEYDRKEKALAMEQRMCVAWWWAVGWGGVGASGW